MKKVKSINESNGIVENDQKQWWDLCDLIVDYVYDLHDGLNSDPLYDPDDTEIHIDNIISYYNYKNSQKMPDYIIPDWIGDLIIYVKNDIPVGGYFMRDSAIIDEDGRLNFSVTINEKNLTPDKMRDTLSHEIGHGYTFWLEFINDFSIKSGRDKQLYSYAKNAFASDSKYGSKIPLTIKSSNRGRNNRSIKLNPEIFTNQLKFEQTILTSFYYSDKSEIKSFMMSFGSQMMQIILNNIGQIKQVLRENQGKTYTHILSQIPVSCYDNQFYKIYKSYQEFWNGIDNVEDEIIETTVNSIKRHIKVYLQLPHNSQINKDTLLKVRDKELITYNKVVHKMERAFVDLISKIPY